MIYNEIFTIGHSDHAFERFLELLARHQIGAVADVRSSPHSRFCPQFNHEDLAGRLNAAGIHYVFMGNELGARRSESDCYVDGKARYELIARLPLFQEGIVRLQYGASRHRIALMCAEKDPLTCHRSILICRHLRNSLSINHILSDGDIEAHEHLEERLLKAVQVIGEDLLNTYSEAVEHAYDLQADRIAYSENRQLAQKGIR